MFLFVLFNMFMYFNLFLRFNKGVAILILTVFTYFKSIEKNLWV